MSLLTGRTRRKAVLTSTVDIDQSSFAARANTILKAVFEAVGASACISSFSSNPLMTSFALGFTSQSGYSFSVIIHLFDISF